jgi:hypothetical protein
MSNLLWFLLGAVLMDFIWAWKFGIPQLCWTRTVFWGKKLYSSRKYR